MIETRRLKNVIFFQTILSFVLSRKIIHIRNLKQTLNHGLVFKNVHMVIKFNHNAWLKPYIDINTDLRKKEKMILKNIFLG